MQTIYLDISNCGVTPVVYAKQGDVGRKVEIVLTNSGLPYEPEAGSAFSAWFSGDSGVGNYTDIGDHSAFSVSGNKVTMELITQMLQNAGKGIMCLVLSRAGGDQIGLWNIPYICEGIPGAGSEHAKDYYTAFSQAVAALPYPDASLSVTGKAADAAATGKALDGKAPAAIMELAKAFGINTAHIIDVPNSNFNTLTGNGIYKGLQGNAIGLPDCIGELAFVLTLHYDDGGMFGKQIAWDMNGNTTCQRYKRNGVWNPWECDNPPMVLGVEYRTTKRFLGKTVYVKMIPFGALPNASIKNLYHGITGVTNIVSVNVYSTYGSFWSTHPNLLGVWGETDAINIITRDDMSMYSANCVVEYTLD